MEKMNCDIIRDLIPSYVDEVCSQATKECVEAHLEECGECRLIAARCQDSTLAAEKLEQQELDGLKKIKKIMDFQRLACGLLLLFLAWCGILLFLAQKAGYDIFNYTGPIAAICIIVILVSGIGSKEKHAPGKTAYLCGAVSLMLDIYVIMLLLYFTSKLTPDVETIFGLKLYETGPFLNWQLAAAFFAQIAFFIYNLWCIFRHDQNCSWLLCLNVSGIFLAMNYDLGLYCMDTWETLMPAYRDNTLTAAVPGVLGIIASLLISRKRKNADSLESV